MKAKGLIVKPYPEHWTKWMNPDKPNERFTKEEMEFNNSLLIEKRPYFMKYLYPTYKNQYKNHYDTYDYFCNRKYGISIDELLRLSNRTQEQEKIVYNYNKYNPLLETACVMNNICRYMEKEVKEIKINSKKKSPDYILDIIFNKSIPIVKEKADEMEKVYKRYRKSRRQSCNVKNDSTELKEEENLKKDGFSCFDFDYISDDIQELANLAIYVNYYLYPNSPKNFCWDLFGEGIIYNIYDNSNYKFEIPLLDNKGDIEYMGKRYKNKEVKIDCL